MLKIAQIQEYAEKTNKKFEIDYPQSNIRTQRSSYVTEIGVQMSDWIWYWWEAPSFQNEDCDAFFRQRYSQRTGQNVRGWRVGYNAE